MLEKIDKDVMHVASRGWLTSRFHFSFAEYYDSKNIHFGVLRVLNDDIVAPQTGFETHSHKDMEIVSYVVEGELTHKDSMKNKETLDAHNVQYMSAGTGVTHSEKNDSESLYLRFLQIWIYPDKNNLTPNYGSFKYEKKDFVNTIKHIVSPLSGSASVKINQDANIYASLLEENATLSFELQEKRQIYLVMIEGVMLINNMEVSKYDAVKITDELTLSFKALANSHFLFIEMASAVSDVDYF
ncbi:hypothetical protein BKH43_06460 [Helicobacter sp. 13S00401-1]|uniref:pirin family protein n=1 Tax=Helicobacter sp. 13S00401-1 TaxID=1905758 RepID=UPI000BA6DF99|nr:pirin family protein [Helicobacter sp. 13S00401-1]PAF49727.1 hypothetical protein BKH43_06460 [Helicobacter sp. 13S00401-1]